MQLGIRVLRDLAVSSLLFGGRLAGSVVGQGEQKTMIV
jgi:hypothetical protein